MVPGEEEGLGGVDIDLSGEVLVEKVVLNKGGGEMNFMFKGNAFFIGKR